MKTISKILFTSMIGISMYSSNSYAQEYSGSNILMAARSQDTLAIKKMIEQGADINQRDKNGDTPLCTAIRMRDYNAIYTLQSFGGTILGCKGIDPNANRQQSAKKKNSKKTTMALAALAVALGSSTLDTEGNPEVSGDDSSSTGGSTGDGDTGGTGTSQYIQKGIDILNMPNFILGAANVPVDITFNTSTDQIAGTQTSDYKHHLSMIGYNTPYKKGYTGKQYVRNAEGLIAFDFDGNGTADFYGTGDGNEDWDADGSIDHNEVDVAPADGAPDVDYNNNTLLDLDTDLDGHNEVIAIDPADLLLKKKIRTSILSDGIAGVTTLGSIAGVADATDNLVNTNEYTTIVSDLATNGYDTTGFNLDLVNTDNDPTGGTQGTQLATIIANPFDGTEDGTGMVGVAPESEILAFNVNEQSIFTALKQNVTYKTVGAETTATSMSDIILYDDIGSMYNASGVANYDYTGKYIEDHINDSGIIDDALGKILSSNGFTTGDQSTEITAFKKFAIAMDNIDSDDKPVIVMPAGDDGLNSAVISSSNLESMLPAIYEELEDTFISVVAVDDGYNGTTIRDVNADTIPEYLLLEAGMINVDPDNLYDNDINDTYKGSNACGGSMDWCLAAPGEGIYTETGTISGTQAAASVVAGAVAVMKSAFSQLTSEEIVQILFETAKDLGEEGVDEIYGHGLLDLNAALNPSGDVVIFIKNPDYTSSTNSVINLGSAFGTSLMTDVSLLTMDEYDRSYNIEVDSLINFTSNAYSFNNLMSNFTNQEITSESNFDNLNFKLAMKEESVTNEGSTITTLNFSNMEVSMNFAESETSNTTQSLAYGENIESKFTSDLFNKINFSNIVTEDALRNPMFNFINEGIVTKTKLSFNEKTNNDLLETKKEETDYISISFFSGKQTYKSEVLNYNAQINDSMYEEEVIGKAFGFVFDLTTSINDNFKLDFQIGSLTEEQTVLGSQTEGIFALNNNTTTNFVSLYSNYKLSKKANIYTSYTLGLTNAPTADYNSIFTTLSDIKTQSASIGFISNKTFNKNDTIGFIVSSPLKVTSSTAVMNYADSYDYDNDIALYKNELVNLAPTKTEIDLQAFYSLKEGNSSATGAIVHKINPMHSDQYDNETILMFKIASDM